ncbi:MAG: hypothetical protein P8O99_05475 [Pseudomonadales bacterium]|nr:hypothetical protein [Pseudomonadales bacterium]
MFYSAVWRELNGWSLMHRAQDGELYPITVATDMMVTALAEK